MDGTPSLPLLALFYGRLGDSRLEEVEATAARAGASVVSWPWRREVFRTNGGDEGPSVVQPLVGFTSADHQWLADAAARAVGCRGVFQVWGAGDTLAACAASTEVLSPDHIRRCVDGPWRVELVYLGARHSKHGRDPGQRMRHFGHVLDALADRPVRLRGPARQVWLVEDQRFREGGGDLPAPPPRFHLLFALPASVPSIHAVQSALDLRRRAFLGTSTLVADRALMLCNLALTSPTRTQPTLVDPCCGSGGILLAGAALGARVVGSDIDWRVVSANRVPIAIPATAHRPDRGREAVRMTDNFDDAGLPRPHALLTLDMRVPQAAQVLLEANGGAPYDALVTDPPYGRRESRHGTATVPPADALQATLRQLLSLAAAVVRPGGRLVFLAPIASPNAPERPSRTALVAWLQSEAGPRALHLVHLGVERLHRGLHRATVVMERAPSTVGHERSADPSEELLETDSADTQ